MPMGMPMEEVVNALIGGTERLRQLNRNPNYERRQYRFRWYGSDTWTDMRTERVIPSMSKHMLIAVEDCTPELDLRQIEVVAKTIILQDSLNIRRGIPGRNVFIVHGHDETSVGKLAALIEKKGCKPQILSRLPRRGSQTIIECLEQCLPDADLVVALFTGDDEGRKKETGAALKPRARQNVLIEAGYAIIQRRTDSLIVVLGEDVELPSDFDGIRRTQDKAWSFRVEEEISEFMSDRV